MESLQRSEQQEHHQTLAVLLNKIDWLDKQTMSDEFSKTIEELDNSSKEHLSYAIDTLLESDTPLHEDVLQSLFLLKHMLDWDRASIAWLWFEENDHVNSKDTLNLLQNNSSCWIDTSQINHFFIAWNSMSITNIDLHTVSIAVISPNAMRKDYTLPISQIPQEISLDTFTSWDDHFSLTVKIQHWGEWFRSKKLQKQTFLHFYDTNKHNHTQRNTLPDVSTMTFAEKEALNTEIFEEMKERMIARQDSPQYQDMLRNSTHSEKEFIALLQQRKDKINKIKNAQYWEIKNDKRADKKEVSWHSWILWWITIYKEWLWSKDTMLHELIHTEDNYTVPFKPNRLIPSNDKKMIKQALEKNTTLTSKEKRYFGAATEVRARITQLRYLWKTQWIYDPTKEKITREQYQQLIQIPMLGWRWTIKNFYTELKHVFGDEQIFHFLNNLS
jgi:hypothetical protein